MNRVAYKNKADARAYAKRYWQTHREQFNASYARYAKRHPDRVKENKSRYDKSLRGRHTALKFTAKYRKIACHISFKTHAFLLSQPCAYCGGVLSPKGHGLDRKDRKLGYVVKNVVPCCANCNWIKSGLERAGWLYGELLPVLQFAVSLKRKAT